MVQLQPEELIKEKGTDFYCSVCGKILDSVYEEREQNYQEQIGLELCHHS